MSSRKVTFLKDLFVNLIFLDENGNLEFPLVVYLIELLDNFVTIFFSAEFVTRLIICPRNTWYDVISTSPQFNSSFQEN